VSDDRVINKCKGVGGMRVDMGENSPSATLSTTKHFVEDSFNKKRSQRSGMNIGGS
jgi:hypothetical protein